MAKCSELAKSVYDLSFALARTHNISNVDDLVSTLQKSFPELERNRVVDFIHEASTARSRDLSETAKSLAKLRGEVRQDNNLRRSIEEYERAINEQDTVRKVGQKRREPTEAIQNLKQKEKQLKDAYNNTTQANKVRLGKQLDKLVKRIQNKDYVRTPVKESEVPQSKELQRLEFEVRNARQQIRQRIDQIKGENNKILSFMGDLNDSARALKSSFDLGFVGRQAKFVALARPEIAVRALGDIFRNAYDPQKSFQMEQEHIQRDITPLFVRSAGRLFTDDVATPLAEEKAFASELDGKMGSMIERIPGVQASGRAHKLFLNQVRLDYFEALVNKLPIAGEPTDAEAKLLANFVNTATGYGSIEAMQSWMPAMSRLFWSPSLQIARVKTLAAEPIWHGYERGEKDLGDVRKLIAKEYGRLGMGAAVLGSLTALGAVGRGVSLGTNDDDEVSFGIDPRSTDFGQLRIRNTRLDFTGGMRTWAIMVAKVLDGAKKVRSGEITDLVGDGTEFGHGTLRDELETFVTGKFAPAVGAGLNFVTGNPFEDNIRMSPTRLMRDLGVPISIEGVIEAWQEEGATLGTALGIAEIFGESISVDVDNSEGAGGPLGPVIDFEDRLLRR